MQKNVPLRNLTTIGLGGNARFFYECESTTDIVECLNFVRKNNLPILPLGGGSNIVFADEGYDGLVCKIGLRGLIFTEERDTTLVSAMAGENWDDLVCSCIEKGLGGLECLSGIPGSVGAVPVQNVGAYGQEVKDSIELVTCLDRNDGSEILFSVSDCEFDYRSSRFKKKDKDRYIVIRVNFRLKNQASPGISFPEVQRWIDEKFGNDFLSYSPADALKKTREAVISLRRKKSMVVDSADPNSRSAGSFFMNPVVSQSLCDRIRASYPDLPFFPAPGGCKIPAAYLIDRSGIDRSYRIGGAGLSANHSLAIVNFGGSAKDVLALAAWIEKRVEKLFGIALQTEPVIVGNNDHD